MPRRYTALISYRATIGVECTRGSRDLVGLWVLLGPTGSGHHHVGLSPLATVVFISASSHHARLYTGISWSLSAEQSPCGIRRARPLVTYCRLALASRLPQGSLTAHTRRRGVPAFLGGFTHPYTKHLVASTNNRPASTNNRAASTQVGVHARPYRRGELREARGVHK